MEELDELGFFEALEARTGVCVEPDGLSVFGPDALKEMVEVIGEAHPRATRGVANLLADLRDMARGAVQRGVPVLFFF
jgi:hypothetical protein